jgi:NAD(P)-binding Rossmann-like domain
VNRLLEEAPIECIANPDIGRELETQVPEDGDGASAVIVGAGPAGLEAARRLALRGFAVTLLERGDTVGGQMHAWSQAPSRREIRQLLQWWERQLDKHGVDLQLGVEATPQHVIGLRLATLVLATGAVAAPELSVPTDGSATILDAVTGLTTEVGGRVAVCDTVGPLDAMLVAEWLAAGAAERVTLVTGRIHVGEGEGITSLFPFIRRLAELDVTVIERAVPAKLAAGHLPSTGFSVNLGRRSTSTRWWSAGRVAHKPRFSLLFARLASNRCWLAMRCAHAAPRTRSPTEPASDARRQAPRPRGRWRDDTRRSARKRPTPGERIGYVVVDAAPVLFREISLPVNDGFARRATTAVLPARGSGRWGSRR